MLQRRSALVIAVLALGGVALTGCGGSQKPVAIDDILPGLDGPTPLVGVSIHYPLDGALFPPDIAPPTLSWTPFVWPRKRWR